MNDYPLPPPDAAGQALPAQGRDRKSRKHDQLGNLPPPAADSGPPQDQSHVSSFLLGDADASVSQTILEFRQLVHESIPLGKKLDIVSNLFQQAVEPLNIKGDDRSLSQVRIAGGSVVEDIFRNEIEAVKSSPQLSGEQKEKKLQQLRQELDDIPWLAEGFKSSIQMDMAFAAADLKLGKD